MCVDEAVINNLLIDVGNMDDGAAITISIRASTSRSYD